MDTPYVSIGAKELAKGFEKRFTTLPPMAGVLFASVRAVPVVGGKTNEFVIRLGINRKTNPGTAEALIRQVMAEEIKSTLFQFKTAVYQGSPGAARDEDPTEPDPLAA